MFVIITVYSISSTVVENLASFEKFGFEEEYIVNPVKTNIPIASVILSRQESITLSFSFLLSNSILG